jgi:hypothetical protein
MIFLPLNDIMHLYFGCCQVAPPDSGHQEVVRSGDPTTLLISPLPDIKKQSDFYFAIQINFIYPHDVENLAKVANY